MFEKRVAFVAGFALVAVIVVGVVFLAGRTELDQVRAATREFKDVAVAEAAGYFNVNVGECVESPEGTMGYHFLKEGLLDLQLASDSPELLVYAPEPDGSLKLVAVEYAVPIEPWDAQMEGVPSVMGQDLHANSDLGLYVLHGWVWEENPSGVFADWNPSLSCES